MLSNIDRRRYADYMFTGGDIPTPPQQWFAGFSRVITSGDPQLLDEPTSASYGRSEVSGWTRTGSAILNTNDIVFPSAVGSWGVVREVVLFDELGVLRAVMDINEIQQVEIADTDVTILASALVINA